MILSTMVGFLYVDTPTELELNNNSPLLAEEDTNDQLNLKHQMKAKSWYPTGKVTGLKPEHHLQGGKRMDANHPLMMPNCTINCLANS